MRPLNLKIEKNKEHRKVEKSLSSEFIESNFKISLNKNKEIGIEFQKQPRQIHSCINNDGTWRLYLPRQSKRNKFMILLDTQEEITELYDSNDFLDARHPEKKNLEFRSYILKKFEPAKPLTKNADTHLELDFRTGDQARLGLVLKFISSKEFNTEPTIFLDSELKDFLSKKNKKNLPIYVILGVGKSGTNPSRIFSIPIPLSDELDLSIERLNSYEKNVNSRFVFLEQSQTLTVYAKKIYDLSIL